MVRRAPCGQLFPGRDAMKLKLQPFLLSRRNRHQPRACLAMSVSQQGAVAAPGDDGILRGKGLQIVDDRRKGARQHHRSCRRRS